MKDLINLEKELSTNFLNNEINIELEGNITYKVQIKNAKFLLNNIYLIVSDDKENQLNICLDEVGYIKIKERYIEIHFNYEQKIRIFT